MSFEDLRKKFGNVRLWIGDQGIVEFGNGNDELGMFMDAVFGIKRLQIVKIKSNKKGVIERLKKYAAQKGIHTAELNAKNLTTDDIKGEVEIIYQDGIPYSNRRKPSYISDMKQLVVVDNVDKETDIEILRAFIYMGCLGDYWDNLENLPKDKLPSGSGYLFMALDDFPFERFASISDYFRDEVSVLDLRDFETKVKAHLGIYKRNKLKVEENGLYKRNKRQYEHILPEDQWETNILEPYRTDFFTSLYKINYHTDFHHLNSSQAMCINCFYPLIKENKLDMLLPLLGIKGEIDYCCFEKQSELEENADRRTNFDFYIKLKSGDQVYFEIKYTEKEFGKAKKDTEHKNKFYNVYKPLLDSNKAINEQCKTEDYLLDNYQIMRNLVHINDESRVVFIYPEDNLYIREAALAARSEIIADGWERHFILYTWENFIKQLTLNLKNQELSQYYREFEYKYLKY